jgi:hypothetical protein
VSGERAASARNMIRSRIRTRNEPFLRTNANRSLAASPRGERQGSRARSVEFPRSANSEAAFASSGLRTGSKTRQIADEFSQPVSVTIDRSRPCDDSAADTPIGFPRKEAPRSQQRTTPAGRDTQLHRKLAPETARARVRCPREFQATFQQRSEDTVAKELTR